MSAALLMVARSVLLRLQWRWASFQVIFSLTRTYSWGGVKAHRPAAGTNRTTCLSWHLLNSDWRSGSSSYVTSTDGTPQFHAISPRGWLFINLVLILTQTLTFLETSRLTLTSSWDENKKFWWWLHPVKPRNPRRNGMKIGCPFYRHLFSDSTLNNTFYQTR